VGLPAIAMVFSHISYDHPAAASLTMAYTAMSVALFGAIRFFASTARG
jgi:hypothetical protein